MPVIGSNGRARKLAEIDDRQMRVAAYYFQGLSQWDIAKKCNVSQPLICKDLGELRKRWRDRADIDFSAYQEQELAKIDFMESQAWEQWQRSKEDIQTVLGERNEEPRFDDNGVKTTIVKVKTGHRKVGKTADVEYMRVIQWCIDKRMQLLAFEPPKKIALTDPTGTEEYSGGGQSTGGPLAALFALAAGALDELASGHRDEAPPASEGQPALMDSADGAADAGV